jgi:hypothetical protein
MSANALHVLSTKKQIFPAILDVRGRATTALNDCLLKAKNYDYDPSYIRAASGQVPLAETDESRKDWALIHCDSRRPYKIRCV